MDEMDARNLRARINRCLQELQVDLDSERVEDIQATVVGVLVMARDALWAIEQEDNEE